MVAHIPVLGLIYRDMAVYAGLDGGHRAGASPTMPSARAGARCQRKTARTKQVSVADRSVRLPAGPLTVAFVLVITGWAYVQARGELCDGTRARGARRP